MIGLAWILSSVFAGPQVNHYPWTCVNMVITNSYLNFSKSVPYQRQYLLYCL
jgi:hypothetical protein